MIATSFDLKFLSRERFVMFKKLCCALLVSSFAISAIAVEPAGGDPGVAALDKAFWIWSDDAKGTQTLGVKTGTKRKIRTFGLHRENGCAGSRMTRRHSSRP